MTKTSNARFAKGSGVYACKCCGYKTRATGNDNADLQLCVLCFDLSGEENHISDHCCTSDNAPNVRAMLAALDKQSGAGTAKREFHDVCVFVGYTDETPVLTQDKAVADIARQDQAKEMLLTIDAACKFIRASRNRTIFLGVHQYAPIEGKDDKVFPVYGHVKMSAPAACEFVKGAYAEFEERGGRVRISLLGVYMFVGQ